MIQLKDKGTNGKMIVLLACMHPENSTFRSIFILFWPSFIVDILQRNALIEIKHKGGIE